MSFDQVGILIENCNSRSIKLHRKAVIYKWLSNLANFTIIVGSAASGTISAYRGEELSNIILSFSVTTIKGLMIFFTPERRAITLERVSIELSRLSRKLRRLDTAQPDCQLVKKVIDKTYDRLDELKLKQFSEEAGKIVEKDSSSLV